MASVTPRMQWATTLSRRADARHAVAEAAESILDTLGGPPDLVLMFVAASHAPSYERILEAANSVLPARCLLGCSAVGIIGAGVEVERSEAVALVAARLPGVELFPFYLPGAQRVGGPVEPWSEVIGADPREMGCYVLLADPFSIEAESWLERFDAACPNVPKVGGLLSGADAPGDGALFHGERVYRNGLLGLGMRGNIELSALVAQGCRPIGEPMIITSCKDSVIYELDAGRPVDVLQKLFDKLEPRDQELCRHSLFVGIEMSDRSHRYGQGDFLIRDLAGMDPNGGAMALQGRCRNYQVVQFHLRDARTSAQDLEQRLRALGDSPAAERARGALLFSCLGRGRSLYGTPNHDTDAFLAAMGGLPAGGFFAGGEIGPVGGRTFLHGYTSVFGVFGTKEKNEDGPR